MVYTFRIEVTLKPDVLDIQGKAIMNSLHNAGETSVKSVSAGKIICLDIEADSLDIARNKVETISRDLLSNPLIENYLIHELKADFKT